MKSTFFLARWAGGWYTEEKREEARAVYYIYILRCGDGSLYTGVAADLERRLRQHEAGGPTAAKYTRAHGFSGLETAWTAESRASAQRLEYAIKRLPREKKLALIAAPNTWREQCPGLAQEEYEVME